jgi:hypothetical protein
MTTDKLLKEHKMFRNQLIVMTLLTIIMGFFVIEILPIGSIFLILSIFNIFSYRENLKDYNTILRNRGGR